MISIIITFFSFFLFSFISYASNDDIKGIRGPVIDLNNYLLYQFVIIFLLLGLLAYYHFYVDKNLKMKKQIDQKDLQKKQLVKNLTKLKKDIDTYLKSDFYSELNGYFRCYFSLLGIQNSETLTLNELKKLEIDSKLINIFEKSYFNEFNDLNDDNTSRKEIIDQLIKNIK